MEPERIVEIGSLGRRTFASDVVITGADPALATPWPVGEVAAVALAMAGDAAARLARRAGGDPGSVRADVGDAAAATIGFALMRVDGESMARTNADNPWVGRYRCGDGRWIHLHGGFPGLADRLASLLALPVDANEATIAGAVTAWESPALEDAIAERRGCSAIIRTEDEWRCHPHGELVHSWPTIGQRAAEVEARGRWAQWYSTPTSWSRVIDPVSWGATARRSVAARGRIRRRVRVGLGLWPRGTVGRSRRVGAVGTGDEWSVPGPER